MTDPDTTGLAPGGPPVAPGPGPEPLDPAPRDRLTRVVWAAVVVILVAVVGLVTYALTRPPSTPRTVHRAATPADVVSAITQVPTSVFDSIGVSAPTTPLVVPTLLGGQSPLTSHGRPEVLYVGAEFCPFCAAERWPLIVALSRFGHFSELSDIQSSASSVFPSLSTFTFVGAHYSSPYVTFAGIELYSGAVDAQGVYTPIATLNPVQSFLVSHYGTPPVKHGSEAGSFPFVDIGNRMVTSTSGFSPGVIVGQSQAAIAGDLRQPSEPIGQAVVASANYLTAGICAATGQRPASTCDSKGVRAAAASLATS